MATPSQNLSVPATSDRGGAPNNDVSDATSTARAAGSTATRATFHRRTKTGCLTCRNRRIKCGEERPVCAHCTSSRRLCNWHQQPGSFGYDGPQATSMRHAAGTLDIGVPIVPQPGLPQIYSNFVEMPLHVHVPTPQLGVPQQQSPYYGDSLTTPPAGPGGHTQPHHSYHVHSRSEHIQPTWVRSPGHDISPALSVTNSVSSYFPPQGHPSPLHDHANDLVAPYGNDVVSPGGYIPHPSFTGAQSAGFSQVNASAITSGVGSTWAQVELDPQYVVASTEIFDPVTAGNDPSLEQATQYYHDGGSHNNNFDEDDIRGSTQQENMFPGQVALVTNNAMLSRSPTNFSTEWSLEGYRPEKDADPLRNPMTNYVFAHFAHVTSSTMNLFTFAPDNRHISPQDPSLPWTKQGLWTSIMPRAALSNQGLLQAMLAISSLHIAQMHGKSPTPSLKHYAYALKKIHIAVASRSKERLALPVIAASLLLGFYEIWTADHAKWSSHLKGAGQLLTECGIRGIYNRLRADNLSGRIDLSNLGGPSVDTDRKLDQMFNIDTELLHALTGLTVDFTVVKSEDGGESHPISMDHSGIDLSSFDTLRNLYWWYKKQDIIQSIVSGNDIMLSWDHWVDCPPRSRINLPHDVYGSYDHLLLLMARICHFVVQDRGRKLHVAQAGFRPGQNPMRGMPFGMAPSESVPMPHVYQPSRSTSSSGSISQDAMDDLQQATASAIQQWSEINDALGIFKAALSDPYYAPILSADTDEVGTPFGPMVSYRSPHVAALWSYYYLALMVSYRSHPNMPPYAHIAAAVAAQQTSEAALMIGRIGCGLAFPQAGSDLHPTLGGALCDCTLPLFFAAVQYQDNDQRLWTVNRLFETERRCGQATAGLIAYGVQTAWAKAFEAGRGPPFEMRNNTYSYRTDAHSGALDIAPVYIGREDGSLIPADTNSRHTFAAGVLSNPLENF